MMHHRLEIEKEKKQNIYLYSCGIGSYEGDVHN